jgi:hypothetical protein
MQSFRRIHRSALLRELPNFIPSLEERQQAMVLRAGLPNKEVEDDVVEHNLELCLHKLGVVQNEAVGAVVVEDTEDGGGGKIERSTLGGGAVCETEDEGEDGVEFGAVRYVEVASSIVD